MPGRGLGVRPVGPELGQYTGVVAPWHDLWLVRLARGGIELVPRSGIAAFVRVEEGRVVLEVGRIVPDVAETRRGNVHGFAIGGIQVGRPNRDQRVGPAVVVRQRAVDGRRHARIVVNPVVEVVAPIDRPVRLGERERHDDAPLRAQELGIVGHGIAGLVDECLEAKRLPAVQVNDVGIARQVGFEGRIDGFVAYVGVVVRLVGAIGETEVHVALSDAVAEHRDIAFCARIKSEGAHQRVGVAANQAGPRRQHEPVPNQTIGGKTHGLFAGVVNVLGRGPFDVACDLCALATEQPRLGRVVERGPNVVHRRRQMEQVAGVDRGARVVVADRLQQQFAPAPRHGHVVGQSRPPACSGRPP